MRDPVMSQNSQMARSKFSGRIGPILIDPPRVSIEIPHTIPQWMTTEEFHAGWEIVEPCESCKGSGYKAVRR